MSLSVLSLTCLALAAISPSFVTKGGPQKIADVVFPEVGSVDPSANFYQKWQPDSYGVKRTGDREFLVHGKEEWGYRGTTYNTFNGDDFRFSLDLSRLPGNVAAFVLLSPNACDFVGGGGGGSACLSMDMVKSPSDPTNFIVTLTAGGDHNTSIAGFGDGAWPVDGAYSGSSITSSNGVVAVSFQNNGTTTQVAVNEKTYTVDSSVLYAKMGTSHTGMYASMGMFNGAPGAYGDIRVNYWGDAAEETYYSSTGLYGMAKQGIADLSVAVNAGLTTLSDLKAAKAIRETISLTNLHDFDVRYLKPNLDILDAALAQAAVDLGGEALLADYEDAVAKLTTLDASLSDATGIDAALAQVDFVNAKKAAASVESVVASYTTDQNDKLASLNGLFDAEMNKIKAAITTYYAAKVNAYTAATSNLVTVQDINNARILASAIPTKYNSQLNDLDLIAFNQQIAAADEKIEALGHAAVEGWDIGSGAYMAKNGDKMGINLAANSGTSGEDHLTSSGVYYNKEKLSASDFSFTIDRKVWSTLSTSWFSFGLMEKSDIFNNADNLDCQNNKGVFFLLTSIGNGQVKAELYTMSLTCNRFFDAVQSVSLIIPLEGNLTVQFAEVQKEVSGITETYWIPSFNGVPLDGNNIKATKLKSCLGSDKSGYFYMASTATSPEHAYVYDLVDVNGHKPYEASLSNMAVAAPTTSDTTLSYNTAVDGDLSVNLDTKSQALTAVKIDDSVLGANDYTYDATTKKLLVKAAKLQTLSNGAHVLTMTTAGGSVTVTLNVTSGTSSSSSTSEPNSSTSQGNTTTGGCGGSITGSIVVSGLALVGLAGLAMRKKHVK